MLYFRNSAFKTIDCSGPTKLCCPRREKNLRHFTTQTGDLPNGAFFPEYLFAYKDALRSNVQLGQLYGEQPHKQSSDLRKVRLRSTLGMSRA